MKTLEQIKQYSMQTLDGRDLSRLAIFFTEDELKEKGLEYTGTEPYKQEEFTRDNVLKRLERDLEFAFEKALDKRGISALFMYQTIKMWNWVLEEGLEDWSDDCYAQYGLPLLKATAEKYGFDNPIGDDDGDEYQYSAEADY